MMKSNKITFEKYNAVKVKPYDIQKKKLLNDKINKVSKSIRKKYLALKLGKAAEDETLNRLLKPVIDPLKELKSVNTRILQKKDKKYIDSHQKKFKHDSYGDESVEKELFSSEHKDNKEKDEEDEEDEEEAVDKEGDEEEVKDEEYSNFEAMYDTTEKAALDEYFGRYPSLARNYIAGFFTKRKNYDETYGVRLDLQTNKLYIGNMELNIGRNSEIHIGDRVYDGKEGLYNLLFMKNPIEYDKNDLTKYKEILQITSAYKRNYDPLGQINGTRSSKYTKIIRPLFDGTKKKKAVTQSTSSSSSGSGMNMVYNEKPIEYVYWDDVNELVDRLRLLNASKSAGNTDSHDNEILAIINELREAGIIY